MSKHPVLELLEARRASGSTRLTRSDGAVLGLAVEGGGTRGIVSAGMLMALDDLGFTPSIDKVFGSSSGGINAALYLQGDLWRAESLYYYLAGSNRFVDILGPLRGEAIVDIKQALDEVLRIGLWVDAEKVASAGPELHVAVTDVDNAVLRLESVFGSSDDLIGALVAGCWLPILAGPPFVFRDYRALDGGVLLEHPARAAVDGGCTHILVLSTRYPRIRPRIEPWRYVIREYLRRLNPKLAHEFWKHSCRTVNYREAMTRGNVDLAKGPAMLTVTPRPEWAELPKVEPGRLAFQNAMKEGYESLRAHMSSLDSEPALPAF